MHLLSVLDGRNQASLKHRPWQAQLLPFSCTSSKGIDGAQASKQENAELKQFSFRAALQGTDENMHHHR
jgi:hypothetical protein